MNTMIDERVLKTMSTVFEIPLTSLGKTPALGEIEGWDSLSHVQLIKALEKEFKIKFDDDDFEAMVNLENIVVIVSSHLE